MRRMEDPSSGGHLVAVDGVVSKPLNDRDVSIERSASGGLAELRLDSETTVVDYRPEGTIPFPRR